jgi:transposase-like protein
MTRPGRYPQELRERAAQMVFEYQDEHDSQWAAICSIANKSWSQMKDRGVGTRRPLPS